MARRAERTTALPRPRPRKEVAQGRRVLGIEWTERHSRWGILAAVIVLGLIVAGLFTYQQVDEHYLTPNKTILTVGDEHFKLSYYTDRLYEYAQTNQSSGLSLAILEQQLLTKLEDEAVTIKLAEERNINLSDDEITKQIASELGVPVGGPGSSFDTLYRQRLKTTKMSDGNYRQLAKASLANSKLLESVRNDIGSTGEMVTIKGVVSASKDDADKILARVKGGEDLGSVAQTDSTDLQSRQNDGTMLPEPPVLLPANIQAAIKDKPEGTDLLGPVQVGSNYWVFRIEKRDPNGTYSDAQKDQLAQAKLDELIKAKRDSLNVKRDLSSSDLAWAEKNAG